PPAARGPVPAVDSPGRHRHPGGGLDGGVLADSHLAGPITVDHCLDHLLSGVLARYATGSGRAIEYSADPGAGLPEAANRKLGSWPRHGTRNCGRAVTGSPL